MRLATDSVLGFRTGMTTVYDGEPIELHVYETTEGFNARKNMYEIGTNRFLREFEKLNFSKIRMNRTEKCVFKGGYEVMFYAFPMDGCAIGIHVVTVRKTNHLRQVI